MANDGNEASQRVMDERGEPRSLGEFGGHEIYPMPMFATPSVADVAGTASWYERALGFASVFEAPAVNGQPSLVHLRRNKYQDLLLVPTVGTSNSAPSSLTLSFQTTDVDALAARARSVAALGVSSIDGPIDTPWNTRDLRATDPAGHRLIFTSRQANPDPEHAARWKAIFEAAREP